MKRENFRKIPNNLLPKEVRNPESSFEEKYGNLTREEILAEESRLEEGAIGNVLTMAGDVIDEKEKELNADLKRAEEVVLKVIEEAEKRKSKEQ